jgi:hypothetical protein
VYKRQFFGKSLSVTSREPFPCVPFFCTRTCHPRSDPRKGHSRYCGKPERIRVAFSTKPNALAVSFYREAIIANADLVCQAVRDKVSSEIKAESCVVLETNGEARELVGSFEQNEWPPGIMQNSGRRQSRKAAANNGNGQFV